MARAHRKSTSSVETIKDVLIREPYRFEFHQAITILEHLRPHARPFGETVSPTDAVVAVKSRVYLDPLSSDIYSLDNAVFAPPSPTPPTLHINFMGIAGIQGPLPFPYTEMIIQRVRNGDWSLKDFLDIFNNRLASLLHCIRKQYRISLSTCTPQKTAMGHGLTAILGLGLPALQDRLHVPDRGLLEYASFYWAHPKSALGLTQILRTYFNIPVEIEKCTGRWRRLAKTEVTQIGFHGQWQRLGEGAVLGTRVWDQATHFSVHLGPLNEAQLDLFLPFGKAFPRLKDITQLYIPPNVDFNLRYKVTRPPSTFLGKGSYLGLRAWLGESLLTGDEVKVYNVKG